MYGNEHREVTLSNEISISRRRRHREQPSGLDYLLGISSERAEEYHYEHLSLAKIRLL